MRRLLFSRSLVCLLAVLLALSGGAAAIAQAPTTVPFSSGVPAPYAPAAPAVEGCAAALPSPRTYNPPPITNLNLTPFLEGEYLYWWVRDRALPPLVTTSTSQASLGVLDRPDTRVLYGGAGDGQARSGGRFTLGVDWALRDACSSPDYQGRVEAVYFFLGRQNNGFDASSDGSSVLARPFFNVVTGTQFSEQVANQQVGTIPPGPGPRPGFARAFQGSITIDNPSQIHGGELNAVFDNLTIRDGTENGWLQGLVGFRCLGLTESLRVHEDLTLPATSDQTVAPPAVLLPETTIQLTDEFRTRNLFYGPQLGFKTGFRMGVVSLRLASKVALGWMDQVVEIRGSNTNIVRDIATGQLLPPTTTASGLLAQPTNSGRYERTRFAVVPETTIDLGWHLRDNVRLSVGYNFLYASNVVRPGDVIDVAVDPRFRNGGAAPTDATRPAFVFRNSDLWLQGLNFGLDLRY